MALSCVLAFALGCAAEAENVPSGGRGGTSSGDAGSAGTGGTADRGGSGGVGGMSGYGPGCSQATFSLDSRVGGEGFDYPDGTAVRAYFAASSERAVTATDTFEAGAFSFSFSLANEPCNLGAPGGGALYVDVNGDGECSVTDDDVFVWAAQAIHPSSPDLLVAFSPDSPQCLGLDPPTDAYALAAAQHLCPSVGNCLAFCGPEPFTVNGDFVAFCPSPDAGGPDADDVDAGESDASPSDADD